MKKTFIYTILFFAASIAGALGQVSLGLRTGVNFSKMQIGYIGSGVGQLDHNATKIGPNIAIVTNFKFEDDSPWSIQVEPGFSQIGLKGKQDVTDTKSNGITYRNKSEWTLTGNYVAMPVLLKFSPVIGPVEGVLTLGLEPGLRLGNMRSKTSSSDYENGILKKNKETEEDMNWGYSYVQPKKMSYSFLVGAGVAIPLQYVRIFAECRYHYGFAKTYKYLGYSFSQSVNRGISASIGILFPLGQ